MAFYLSPFTGTGSPADPYRPDVHPDAEFSIIDLRGDVTQQAGWCLLWMDDSEAPPNGGVTLPDLDTNLPGGARTALNNRLGVSTTGSTSLRQTIVELLLVHGSFPDPGKWNPLQARKHGFHEIRLGPEVVYNAPAIQGATITESFDQADSSTLGPDLTWTEVLDDWETTTNEANVVTPDGSASARAESDLDTTDHYAHAYITNNGGTSDATRPGCAVRFSSSAETYYAYVNRSSGATAARKIQKNVTGTVTDLASRDGTMLSGDGLRIEADGSLISGFLAAPATTNWNGLLYVTDTSITTGTRAGIVTTNGGDYDYTFNNFEAGDLPASRVYLVGISQEGSALNGTNVTLTYDTDAPPAEGDYTLLLGGVGTGGTTGKTKGPSTAGYTEWVTRDTTGETFAGGAWYKKQGATPDTTVVGQGTGVAQDGAAYVVYVLRGADQSTFEDATPVLTGPTTSADPDLDAITTQTDWARVFNFFMRDGVDDTGAAPTGYTNKHDLQGADTNRAIVFTATKPVETAGVENPAAWTLVGSAEWFGWMLAVRPAAGVAKYDNSRLVSNKPVPKADADRLASKKLVSAKKIA